MKTRYTVVVNGTWHPYTWVFDLEEAKARAREHQARGDDAQIFALVETHYYKAKVTDAE